MNLSILFIIFLLCSYTSSFIQTSRGISSPRPIITNQKEEENHQNTGEEKNKKNTLFKKAQDTTTTTTRSEVSSGDVGNSKASTTTPSDKMAPVVVDTIEDETLLEKMVRYIFWVFKIMPKLSKL